MRAPLAALVGSTILVAAPALGWTPKSQVLIGEAGARLAPADLNRQIQKHAESFRKGLLDPFRDSAPARHRCHERGCELESLLVERSAGIVRMIQEHRPFSEVVYQLGVVAHFIADANNPLNVSDADAQEGRYFEDYVRYAQDAQSRFKIVYYGTSGPLAIASRPAATAPRPETVIPAQLQTTRERSLALYPMLGKEYLRIGYRAGRSHFDDRSTAFGLTAVATSRAASDVALLLRYIWLAAGGADPRPLADPDRSTLYVLPAPEPQR